YEISRDWSSDVCSSDLGAGSDAYQAMNPAVLGTAASGRVLLFSFGSTTCGISEDWKATSISPGVNLLDDLSEQTAARVCDEMREIGRASCRERVKSGEV